MSQTMKRVHAAPMALVSLNSVGVLLDQAKLYEEFAGTEPSLSANPGARERMWRAAAPCRVVAHLLADDPGCLAAYCQVVDRERAQP
jgi:hypothetical protein